MLYSKNIRSYNRKIAGRGVWYPRRMKAQRLRLIMKGKSKGLTIFLSNVPHYPAIWRLRKPIDWPMHGTIMRRNRRIADTGIQRYKNWWRFLSQANAIG